MGKSEKVRKLEKVEEGRGRLEKVGEGRRKLEKVRGRLEKVGEIPPLGGPTGLSKSFVLALLITSAG